MEREVPSGAKAPVSAADVTDGLKPVPFKATAEIVKSKEADPVDLAGISNTHISVERRCGAPSVVLASGSPRRRELLAQVGVEFEVQAADVDETQRAGEDAKAYVERLAREKAEAVAKLRPDAVVIGADTTVALEGEVLGKPADVREAEAMLRRLAGRMHEVHTGVAVVRGTETRSWVETTGVWFGEIDEASLQVYLATEDSLDKAGAYGIQGYAARWVTRIEGCYFNVMGLPVAAVVRVVSGKW